MPELSIYIAARQSSQQVTCALWCFSIIYIKHQGRSTPTRPSYRGRPVPCGDRPLSPAVGLRVTKYVVELSGLSMGGWPAMGLKDNAVPRVALMTLKCWAIMGTWTGL